MNVPNVLTVLRIVMTVGFIQLFLDSHFAAAAILFMLASVTDYWDGYLARKYQLVTAFGKIMDPVADKFLILAAFGLFASIEFVAWWIFWIIAAREIGITVFRFAAMAKGKVLAAEKAGKAKTILQMATIGVMLVFQMLISRWGDAFFQRPVSLFLAAGMVALLWVSVIITVLSGISVIWNNRNIFER